MSDDRELGGEIGYTYLLQQTDLRSFVLGLIEELIAANYRIDREWGDGDVNHADYEKLLRFHVEALMKESPESSHD